MLTNCMTEESTARSKEEQEGLEEAEEAIDEEPGAGAGPAADMDKADPVEDEDQAGEDEK